MNEIMDMMMRLSQEVEVMKRYLLEQQKQGTGGLKETWIDGQDVMQALHISKRKLQTLRDNRTLPFSRIGGKIYYRVADVQGLLDKSYSPGKSYSPFK